MSPAADGRAAAQIPAEPPRGWSLRPVFRLSDGPDCARFYLLLVLPMLLALNMVFPPFHAPDDYDHVKRAHAVARGAIWPRTADGMSSGGWIDVGLARFIEAHYDLVRDGPYRSAGRQPGPDDAGIVASRALGWSPEVVFSEFPGSVSYLPLIYAHQALALAAGEAAGLSVADSVLLARLVNGGLAASIAAFCLAALPFGASVVLWLLLLPKMLLLFASNSADPMFHALALVVLVFATHALGLGWRPRRRHYVIVALCLLAISGARPPLAALALLPFWAAVARRDAFGAVVVVAAVAGAALWFVLALPMIVDLRFGDLGPIGTKATAFATGWPSLVATSFSTYGAYYAVSFIGDIGWSDPFLGRVAQALPVWTYVVAVLVFLAAVLTDTAGALKPRLPLAVISVLTALAVLLLVFFSMFAGATVVGAPLVTGVQGRYFVTVVLLAAVALPRAPGWSTLFPRLFPAMLLFATLAAFTVLLLGGFHVYWVS